MVVNDVINFYIDVFNKIKKYSTKNVEDLINSKSLISNITEISSMSTRFNRKDTKFLDIYFTNLLKLLINLGILIEDIVNVEEDFIVYIDKIISSPTQDPHLSLPNEIGFNSLKMALVFWDNNGVLNKSSFDYHESLKRYKDAEYMINFLNDIKTYMSLILVYLYEDYMERTIFLKKHLDYLFRFYDKKNHSVTPTNELQMTVLPDTNQYKGTALAAAVRVCSGKEEAVSLSSLELSEEYGGGVSIGTFCTDSKVIKEYVMNDEDNTIQHSVDNHILDDEY